MPETDLNGLVGLDYIAPQRDYEVHGDLRRSAISGFESDEMQLRLAWNETSGLTIRSLNFSREG